MACNTPTVNPRKVRILMLHGFTQSGALFHAKTRSLEKALHKAFSASTLDGETPISGVELIYPTGPIKLLGSDLPGEQPMSAAETVEDSWGWWRMEWDGTWFRLAGLDEGLARIADTLQQNGPFDGLLGFSQGAALAAMVASLLESGRKEAFANAPDGIVYPQSFVGLNHPPLKFVVCYSGFMASDPRYRGFYEPKIHTPALHFIGSLDTVVEEDWTMDLANKFIDAEKKHPQSVIMHIGGHFVPTTKKDVATLTRFIRELYCDSGDSRMTPANNGDDVMDMDLPF